MCGCAWVWLAAGLTVLNAISIWVNFRSMGKGLKYERYRDR
jgi:hypothetical protein